MTCVSEFSLAKMLLAGQLGILKACANVLASETRTIAGCLPPAFPSVPEGQQPLLPTLGPSLSGTSKALST